MASVLLIISGGIAAYKSLELIRELSKRSIKTRVILTSGGAKFVTPLSIAALSGERVHVDLFDPQAETQMGHIELSRSSELVVAAPATADLMAKAASGIADDLATTALLATDKPVLMAPAMNVRMWHHAATQANLRTLQSRGIKFVGPDEGTMACHEYGLGRMSEPLAIADAISSMLAEANSLLPRDADGGATSQASLRGRHILVTAGPTVEAIDPVRYLSNRSSGKQGYAVAAALCKLGAKVTLVSGPTNLGVPSGVTRIAVTTAREMLAACERALPADAAVCVAAVADYRPATQSPLKIEKSHVVQLELVANPDILATLSHHAKRPRLVVGFAAQTHEVEAYAHQKLARKGCDWIVANDVSGDVLGGDENEVALIRPEGITRWARMSKHAIADRLASEIATRLA